VSSSNTEHGTGEVVVEMPQMGVSVAEGTLAVWHKQVGDWVDRDEIICEISTDKIDTDVPSPVAGRIVELLVTEEQTVPVGAALARIATDARPGDAHPLEQNGSAHEPDREPGHAPAPAEPADAPPAPADAPPALAAASAQAGGPAPASVAADAGGAAEQRHAAYSPVVQRIAAEHGIDLATVRGTGRGGRVRKQDVLALVARGKFESPAARPATEPPAADTDPEPPAADTDPEPPADRDAAPPLQPQAQRLSRMRRAIADHMTRSLQTAAHCTTIIEADFSGVERERERLGCSPLPIVARAVVDALQRHPGLNSTLEGEQLTQHREVNLGIAVSLGEDGLIVPVIHGAQEFSAEGLATRIRDLARRARENALSPDEVRGGTFTITNPGGYGSIASTPIINQPQVAILDLEAVVKRPVAFTDSEGNDSIAVRPMAYLCLSWDHRALDGALAAQFLSTLRQLLERRQ
jgi:2-oxoglutarate dehydrogenase dihydrolipoamide succinyltransferase (E2 component)